MTSKKVKKIKNVISFHHEEMRYKDISIYLCYSLTEIEQNFSFTTNLANQACLTLLCLPFVQLVQLGLALPSDLESREVLIFQEVQNHLSFQADLAILTVLENINDIF